MLDAGIRDGLPQRAVQQTEIDYATEYPFRAGGYALSLFSTPLNGLILRALADGSMRLATLRREVGGPAQTTLRGNLRKLIGIGALEKRQRDGRGGLVDHALTPAGADLLCVADAIEAWLACAPQGPIRLESETGKAAVKALIGGWCSTMLRALAARPFSLTELDNLITAFSYPALERRLGALRLSGCVEAAEGDGGGTPYAVTDWMRRGTAPLLAAIRCERRHMAGATAPLTRIDVETILLLAIPLVALSTDANGVAQLAVYAGDGADRRSAGVRITVSEGRMSKCSSKLEPSPRSWASGSAADWLEALIEDRSSRLESAGDRALTIDVVASLHRALYLS